ncbi:MAG: sigma-70 family RNA polymerase sigma factor [Clostridia bacterium]|nr:sigma-70 family RNA polymerase sigma factor [Clostridia bacterium]
MNDPAIICLFFKRDESALSETDAKYGAYCKSVAARILENDEDAEECWSDALYKLWQTIPPKKPDDLGAYSAKVARSTAIDRLRKNGAGKRGDKVTEYIEELGDCDAALSAEDEYVSQEFSEVMNRCLGKLSAYQRDMFISRYVLMYPAEEIASAFGISENAVRANLSKTRKKLFELLSKEGKR